MLSKNGGNAILTSRNHKTGTDRIYEAFQKIDLKGIDLIMNLQGDEPAINIDDIVSLNKKMIDSKSRIGTLAAKLKDFKNLENENIVKVITEKNLENDQFSEAKIFTRNSLDIRIIFITI